MRRGASRLGFVFLATSAIVLSADAQNGFDIEEKCNRDFTVAMEYWRSRQIPDALELFTTVVEACPTFVEGYYYKGRSETAMKKYDEAVKSFRQGLEIEPDHKGLRENLAHALVSSKMVEDGIEVYRGLIEEDPENLDYWDRLARAANDVDREIDAVMAASRAVEIRPDSLTLIKYFDYYLAQRHHPVARLQSAEKVLLREPDNVAMMSYVGRMYDRMKIYSRALPVYEREWSLLFPDDGTEGIEYTAARARDMWYYGNVLKANKQFDRAQEVMRKVLEHEKYAADVGLLVATSFLAKDAGHPDEAADYARRALGIDGTNCGAFAALGKAIEGKGTEAESAKDWAGAEKFYQDAKGQFELGAQANCTGVWERYKSYCQAESTRMDERLKIVRQKASQ
jgi:tetratricopeptide (TPR) repeat protein